MNEWDPTALRLCVVCSMLWCVLVFAACGYVVFGMGHSGWWFVVAFLTCSGSCKNYRSPAQIAADPYDDEE